MDEIFLQIRDRHGKLSRVDVDRFPFSMGRGSDNDLIIHDPSVSREHAYLRLSADGISIVDNSSRNGIYVNSDRVEKERVLRPGDVLLVGSVMVHFMPQSTEDIPVISGEKDAHVEFFPSQKDWDPMESFAGTMPGEPAVQEERHDARMASLRWMFKLFLEAPLPEIYEHILDLVEETVPFDRCYLILLEEGDTEKMEIVSRRMNSRHGSEVIVSQEILRRVARKGDAVIVSAGDADYSPSESFIRSGASTAICVPLIVRSNVIGCLYLDRFFAERSLTQDDIELLGPLAGFVALKIENVRLLQSHIDNQVLYRDLELAKTIQEGLLPHEPVRLQGYSVEGYTSSCYQVGGDYFDFLPRSSERLFVVLGDVSGKGLSSALYMAGIRSALHAHVEDGLELDQLMVRLEKHASKSFRPDYFLTLVVGHLDVAGGVFTYCNAGHLPPVIINRDGVVRELDATDPALNVADCDEFHCHEIQLQPGDLLFLYTDGLVEAANPEEKFFGLERLLDFVARHRENPLPELRKSLLAAIEEYTGEDSASDDRTLILVRREELTVFDELDALTDDIDEPF